MAESKSLKEAVNEINNNLKAHFGTKISIGKTKTPDQNSDKQSEINLQELTYSQMIMGSLASMVWGVQNIKDDVKVKALLNRKNNIYDIVAFASNEGGTEYNIALSQRRADAVKAYLEGRGCKINSAVGKGVAFGITTGRVAVVTSK